MLEEKDIAWSFIVRDGYEGLHDVMHDALDQAQIGKGNIRHNIRGEAFEDQQIIEIDARLQNSPCQGVLFQVVKKVYESADLEPEKAVHELRGAMVYLGAALIRYNEFLKGGKESK
jgi:hypothetical protein